jgi:light-regulated signal transduction histidine kinase (bacteriophytochrome)
MHPTGNSTREPALPAHGAEQELAEFSYIVSHDLAASFRHIREFSRFLVAELGERPSAALEHAHFVQAAAEKCQTMLDALLTYSRVQQRALSLADCNMRDVVEMAVLQLGSQIREAASILQLEIEGCAHGDREMLTDAFKLLIENALRFRRPGATCRIFISGGADQSGVWRGHVGDNGAGLAEQYWDKAFQMFWRLDPSHAGVGAGLAVCRRMIRRCGGEVRFTAQESGAAVEVLLTTSEGAPDG